MSYLATLTADDAEVDAIGDVVTHDTQLLSVSRLHVLRPLCVKTTHILLILG